MDAKIINAFLTEGINAFQTMFGIKPEAKEPHLLDVNAGHPWEISGLLGITGDFKFRSKNLTIRYGKPFKVGNMTLKEANDKLFNEVKKLIKLNLNKAC